MEKTKRNTHFYTYYFFEEWGRGYIGSRGCPCPPEEDNEYFGSFKDKNFNPTQKIILNVQNTRKEAYDEEIILHDFFDVVKNPHFVNRSKQTTVGFTTEGYRHTDDSKQKIGKESRERKRTPETKRKASENNKGKKRSEETRKKNAEAARSLKWWHNPGTGEVRKAKECPGEGWENKRGPMSPQSKESNEKRSKSLKGRPKSDTHKKNLSISSLTRHREKRVKSLMN